MLEDELDEKEIHQRIQGGDESAALEIVAANCESIWPIARSLAKEGNKWTPEDLYQEGALAMIRFAQRWEYREGIPFVAACRMRVRGSMKDFLRRKADTMRHQDGQLLSLDCGSSDDPDGRTLGEIVDSGATLITDRFELPATLSKQEKAVLELRVLIAPPVPVERAAKQLGIKPESLLSLQRRAMHKMQVVA